MNADVSTAEQPAAAQAERIQELYEGVTLAIQDRQMYDERLRVCYDVRHNGVKRKRDMPWQADEPLKIADPAIDTIKPQLVQGIFTADTLATFAASADCVTAEYAKLAAQFFTYHVKRKSNFFRQFVIAVDMELQDGKSIFKVIWNPDKNRIEFHALASIYFIVPTGTEDLAETEWCCQIHRMSRASYKRLAKEQGWPRDDATIDGLTGRLSGTVLPRWADEKRRKEGLHYGSSEDEVVIWEHYQRDENGDWQVTFISPNKLDEPFSEHPYPFKHGKLCYIDFGAELKDKDYHSPRGVVEKILPEERIATKYRNYISDYAAFAARPMFTTNGTPIGNTNNLTAAPGKIFQNVNLTQLEMGEPPAILGEEMTNARQQGERLGGAGDYALQQNTPGNKARTATEIGVVAQMSNVAMDLRSRLNRDSLTLVFEQAWSLLVQYLPGQLKFFFEGKMEELPAAALADAYLIEPSGNPDGMSRAYETQLAMQVFGMCKGDPAYDQDELKKYALEAVDPSLVKRLFVGTKVAQTREAEDQAFDVLLLREGFPVTINPGEDQAARAILTAQYLQRVVLTHEPISQFGTAALQQHIAARVQALKEENPKAAAALVIQLKQIEQQTIQMVKQQQQQQLQQQQLAAAQQTTVPPVTAVPSARPPAAMNGAATPGAPTVPPRGMQPGGAS